MGLSNQWYNVSDLCIYIRMLSIHSKHGKSYDTTSQRKGAGAQTGPSTSP